jgi:hypothetical protein
LIVLPRTDDHIHYPVEVLNRAAGIFRMAGHMFGERLLLFLLRLGLVVSVDDGQQAFPRREASVASTFASMRSIREALGFMGAGPLARKESRKAQDYKDGGVDDV